MPDRGSTDSRLPDLALAPARHLTDRRLRFGFFHHGCANGFAFFHETNLAVLRESRARWNQVTHDHVFLETAETIDLPERGSFGQNTGRILERCCRDEAVGFERRLGDTE